MAAAAGFRMTEDEAKTKWCPMAMQLSKSGSANRPGVIEPGTVGANTLCLGSGCMMWRWLNEVTGRGYCGLAGVVNS